MLVPEPMLARRERRRIEDRKDILAAALALFGEKGYEGGTIQMIAERAGISVGTSYNFFESKEGPYHLAVSLQSLSSAFLFLWLKDPDRNSYCENIDTIARLFFDGATPRDYGVTHPSLVFVALKHPQGAAELRPSAHEAMRAGDVLIVAGSQSSIIQARIDSGADRLAA